MTAASCGTITRMTYDELWRSLSGREPPAGDLVRAIWLAKRGDWDGAHAVVSDREGPMAARIHAYLHRVEGDLSNARYWYGQAGVAPATDSLDEEWERLARALTSA
jgi:hypothetical protein